MDVNFLTHTVHDIGIWSVDVALSRQSRW